MQQHKTAEWGRMGLGCLPYTTNILKQSYNIQKDMQSPFKGLDMNQCKVEVALEQQSHFGQIY